MLGSKIAIRPKRSEEVRELRNTWQWLKMEHFFYTELSRFELNS